MGNSNGRCFKCSKACRHERDEVCSDTTILFRQCSNAFPFGCDKRAQDIVAGIRTFKATSVLGYRSTEAPLENGQACVMRNSRP